MLLSKGQLCRLRYLLFTDFSVEPQSRAGMKLSMDRFEPLLIDVRVDLGSGDVRVAEHFLNNAQIGAVA
jgi:hypothetical protein